MAPAALVVPIARVAGYVLFVMWCALVAVALTILSLLRMARLAIGRGRTPVAFRS